MFVQDANPQTPEQTAPQSQDTSTQTVETHAENADPEHDEPTSGGGPHNHLPQKSQHP